MRVNNWVRVVDIWDEMLLDGVGTFDRDVRGSLGVDAMAF